MRTLRVAASGAKSICQTCSLICASVVDGQSQVDPQFRTNRLYTRLTVAEIRRQLMAQKGYTDEQLPTEETIRTKLNELGYYPKKVAKTQPKKNCGNRRHL